MSKITNDGFTLSGTRCFIAVPIWHQWAYVSEAYVICVMYRQESLADGRCRCNSNYCRDETRPPLYLGGRGWDGLCANKSMNWLTIQTTAGLIAGLQMIRRQHGAVAVVRNRTVWFVAF